MRRAVQLLACFAALLGALLLAGFALKAHNPEGALAASLQAAAHSPAAKLCVLASLLGSPPAALLVYLAVNALAYRRLGVPSAARLLVLLTYPGALALERLTKLIVDRPRPALHALAHPQSSSFPSGHATGITAVVITALAYRALRGSAHQRAAEAVGVLLVAAVSASRLGLGVHYLSDVLAGCALSTLWALSLNRASRTRKQAASGAS